HSYAFGGVSMAINTVQKFLNIPIDYYVQVDMKGFEDIVGAVDGVDVDNTLDFSYGGFHFPKGNIHLNEKKALAYTRMRKTDPNGDFGRQARQRQVIEAVVEKATSFSTITNYNTILQAIKGNVKTNIQLKDVIQMSKN